MDTAAPAAPFSAVRPLGLPVGSVRALLALAITARLILDLKDLGAAAAWLVAAAVIHAVAYFSARSSRGLGGSGGGAGRAPLGLPSGAVRVLLLGGLCVAAWLYLRDHDVAAERLPVLWVLGGFAVGVIARILFTRLKLPQDSSTPRIYHLQALLTLAAAAGLVALGVNRSLTAPGWVEPLLAAFTTYYAAVR